MIAGKMDLARQFYWCDEYSFFKMRVPINEAIAFANATYNASDILEDVPKYFERLISAQRHAKRYINGRLAMLRIEDPEDALPGVEFEPEP